MKETHVHGNCSRFLALALRGAATLIAVLGLVGAPHAQTLPGKRAFEVNGRDYSTPAEACNAIAKDRQLRVSGSKDNGDQYLWCEFANPSDANDKTDQNYGVAKIVCPEHAHDAGKGATCECDTSYTFSGGACAPEKGGSVVDEVNAERTLTTSCITLSDELRNPPASVDEARRLAKEFAQRRADAEAKAAQAAKEAAEAGKRAGRADASPADEQAAVRALARSQDAEILAMTARLNEQAALGYVPNGADQSGVQQPVQIVPAGDGHTTLPLCDSPTIPGGRVSPGAQTFPPGGR